MIEAHPSKSSYLVDEPLFVRLVFRNANPAAMTIREPWLHPQRARVEMYPLRYEVRAADGSLVAPRKGCSYIIGAFGAASDRLREGQPIWLGPGEWFEYWDDLLGQYQLEPGDYRAVPVYGMGLNREAQDLPDDLWQSTRRGREFGFRVVEPAGRNLVAWKALTANGTRAWWLGSVFRSLDIAHGSVYEPSAAYYASEFYIAYRAPVMYKAGVVRSLAGELPESFPFRDRLKTAVAVSRLVALPREMRREAAVEILQAVRQCRDLRWGRAVAYACNAKVAGWDDMWNPSFLRELGWVGEDLQDYWYSWPPEKRPQGP